MVALCYGRSFSITFISLNYKKYEYDGLPIINNILEYFLQVGIDNNSIIWESEMSLKLILEISTKWLYSSGIIKS